MSVLWSFSLFGQISLSIKHLPQFLCVSILDQPVVELNGLYEVLNGDSLVEPVEPFRIILCDKRRGEPGNGQDQTNVSSFLACRFSPQDVVIFFGIP